ncbi:MAG: ATP-dependent DNA helicase PcrA, partial [Lachnospiraceae bacterium]|nr:ATP-dependent DNA helicase PcrA [Lachnospiraceae bacterium]
ITAGGDDSEIEEERRLCYVGITRAMKRLTMTGAKTRMVRGETHYSPISRFVKEIPNDYLEGNTWEPKPRNYMDAPVDAAPKKSMKGAPLAAQTYKKQSFGTKIAKADLDYTVGDRVRHMRFGEGEVVDIAEGGRDYEVTVEFDTAGRKKMFASFAKLQKL